MSSKIPRKKEAREYSVVPAGSQAWSFTLSISWMLSELARGNGYPERDNNALEITRQTMNCLPVDHSRAYCLEDLLRESKVFDRGRNWSMRDGDNYWEWSKRYGSVVT